MSRIYTRATGALCVLVALIFGFFAPGAHAESEPKPGVVVVMTNGVRWGSIDKQSHPSLAQLAGRGSVGNLVPLPAAKGTCPVDAFLAFSAGRQLAPNSIADATNATEEPTPEPTTNSLQRITCPVISATPQSHIENWQAFQDRADRASTGAKLGNFSNLLNENDVSVQGIGTGSGYVLADAQGVVPQNYLDAPSDPAQLAAAVSASAQTNALTVVDADAASILGAPEYIDPTRRTADNLTRLDHIAATLPANTRVLVVSLTATGKNVSMQMAIVAEPRQAAGLEAGESDGASVGARDRSQTEDSAGISNGDRTEDSAGTANGSRTDDSAGTAFDGNDSPTNNSGGIIWSDSVRQNGVMQIPDVVPTVLSWLDIPAPRTVAGTPITQTEFADSTPECAPEENCLAERSDLLVNQSLHSENIRSLRGQFFRILTWGAVAFFVISLLGLAAPIWNSITSKRPVRRIWIWLGLTLASVPLASLLVNMTSWWNAGSPRLALIGGSWLIAGVLAGLAYAARRFHIAAPLVLISGVTAFALIADAAAGSHFMADSPVGFNLLTAARFYGVGNEAFALIGAGSLIGLAFLGNWILSRTKSRWLALSVVAFIGLVIAMIDALPSLGADFGGALSFLPALLVLLLLLSRVKISARRIVVIGAVTVVGALGVALADWMRPPQVRTHLGSFVQSTIDGELWDVLLRKIQTNIRLLTTSNHRWVVLFATLLIVLALVQTFRSSRPQQPANAERSWHYRITAFTDRNWGWLAANPPEPSLANQIPAVIPGLIAALVCTVLGFLLNDSGIVLPGMAAILVVPLLVALVLTNIERRPVTPNEPAAPEFPAASEQAEPAVKNGL